MPTFTFITDYRGGTYICQKQAKDLYAVCLLWKQDIVEGGYVQNLDTGAFANAFANDFDEFPPNAIDEVSNVWLFHLLFGRYALDVHIIQTDTSNNGQMTPLREQAEEKESYQPSGSHLAA